MDGHQPELQRTPSFAMALRKIPTADLSDWISALCTAPR